MTANVKTMMYVGEIPWHGLGTALDKPATAVEAIKASGLDWEVGFQKLYTEKQKLIKERAVIRQDNDVVLGIVGKNYKPVQNAEAFSFFDNVVGQDQAIYHTAGQLGEGEKIWILAKLPTVSQIAKDDVTEQFLLFSNSHDGKSSVRMFFTPIRVVCQNTLNVALQAGQSKGISIRHIGNIEAKINQAQEILGLSSTYYRDFEERAKYLAGITVDSLKVDDFIKKCFQDYDIEKTRTKNMIDNVMENFEIENQTLPSIKNTAWALFNAYTGFIDHQRGSKGDETTRNSNHLNSIWFGSSASLKQNAWENIFDLVK